MRRAAAAVLFVAAAFLSGPARAEQQVDLIAFMLGLRDQAVHAGGGVVKLNGRWGVNEVTRVASGQYKAAHKDGILRLEAAASVPAACTFEVRFTIKTASLIDSNETWTLNLANAAVSVERRPTGPLKGVGLRVTGKDAFCFKSSLRADACTDSQLFDDHTPGTDDADLDRKAAELEGVIAKLKAAGCGTAPAAEAKK